MLWLVFKNVLKYCSNNLQHDKIRELEGKYLRSFENVGTSVKLDRKGDQKIE